jgi:hypothetical protein
MISMAKVSTRGPGHPGAVHGDFARSNDDAHVAARRRSPEISGGQSSAIATTREARHMSMLGAARLARPDYSQAQINRFTTLLD